MEGLSLGLSQKLEQALSPQMIQTLGLFQLSTMELSQKIKEEIEQNPALEMPDEDSPEVPSADPVQDPAELSEEDKDSWDYENSFEDLSSSPSNGPDAYLENVASESQSLREHLAQQLRLSVSEPDDLDLGMLVIGNLDENGFFIESPESLVDPDQLERLQAMIALIQGFDPEGVCVKDYRQSLVLQARLKRLGEDDLEAFEEMVESHFEELKNPKPEQLSRALGITVEEFQFLFDFLKTLNPFPGRAFSSSIAETAVPEFSITSRDGRLTLEMNKSSLPPLSIAEGFSSLADGLSGPEAKEAKAYISDSIKRARTLIDQVKLRYDTLYKVGLSLIANQKEFFLQGPRYLKPMTLKTVAADVGVHETTISRISHEKWVQTDWGLFQIKSFFSQGVQDAEGQGVSRNVVKDRIAQILKDPDVKAMSDQKLADKLASEGLKISRRTVTKYRLELNIDSSYER